MIMEFYKCNVTAFISLKVSKIDVYVLWHEFHHNITTEVT